MANLRETDRLGEEVFGFVRKSEESLLEAGRKWAKTIGELVPVEVPAVRELVKGIFDFTEEVLKVQREFAHNLLRATRPVLRNAETSPRPKRRTTTATHAHRAPPRAAAKRKIA